MEDEDIEALGRFRWSRVVVRTIGTAIAGAGIGCVALGLLYGLTVRGGPHGAPVGIMVGAAVGVLSGALAGIGLAFHSTAGELAVRRDPSLEGVDVIARRTAKACFVVAAVLAIAPLVTDLF